MNFNFYLEKLEHSKEFKKFKQENPEAFLCSGFFVIDKVGKDEKQHLDYCVGDKVFSFQLEQGIKLVPEKVSGGDFNFDYVEKLIVGEMFEKKIKDKIQKILLSLQTKKGKNFFIGTVFISKMGMLQVKIGLPELKIIEFEKKSFFDMVNVFKKDKKGG